mmetsp:Transcript_33897/g.58172  ORF Transcript_33897/g.58172 Transcript_33897/m.58172 type:complete len:244 (+) Transcript_33897:324-1055(+)
MVKDTASNVLSQAKDDTSLRMHFLPLDCTAGSGGCVPLLPEEKDVVIEVDSGYLDIGGSRDMEFLTGTWPSLLPLGELRLVKAAPFDGCSPLENSEVASGALIVAKRGGCAFGDKVMHGQAAGAAGVIVADTTGAAIQRIGASADQARGITIPGLMVSKATGDELVGRLDDGFDVVVALAPQPGMAAAWLELAMTEWPEEKSDAAVAFRQLKAKNAGSTERLAWLQGELKRRYPPVTSKKDEL